MVIQAGGKMSRRLVIGVVLLTVFAASAFVLRPVGEFGVIDSRIAAAHEGSRFSLQAWNSHDQAKRGQMVADLARRHRFIGMRRDSVVALLGQPECYEHVSEEPCYRLRLGHSDFELQFPVHASSNPRRILAIRLNRL